MNKKNIRLSKIAFPKNQTRKQRFDMTLLFSSIVFVLLLLTALIVALTIFILAKTGAVELSMENMPKIKTLLLWAMFGSIGVGTILTISTGRFSLRPLNHLCNKMNQLASGDFSARLIPARFFYNMPFLKDFCDGFNKMAEELQNTEMLRSDFVNNLSHEFKTPIASIYGFAKLLKTGNLDESTQKEYIAIIESESKRLSALANNVLMLGKVENQSILTERTEYNVSEQIRECFLLLENRWSEKNIDLVLDFDEYNIVGNKELLNQVWINLIDNAIKYAPVGEKIEVIIQKKDGNIAVAVINTGSFIPKEHLNRVFFKFYQEDTSHHTEGNGVGLAIVKRICQLHGGNVTAQSENNVTTFTVTLPQP